ncbi:MAG: glutamyl-tRNA reductase [Candidatus Binatia bacterium]|nr:glutamyl-tRNA reductase [Candidatus Binatia bacterium]
MSERESAKVRPLRAEESADRDVDLWVVGLNHKTAPVELREKLAIGELALGPMAERALERLPLREAVILSTCNRVEVVGVSPRGSDVVDDVMNFIAEDRDLSAAAIAEHRYVHRGRQAVRHLFRVAASLDSMVVGEPQILGQLKEQYRLATESGATARVLRRCFDASFRVAKRVRTETGVAAKSVSVSSAAVDLAKRIFDDLGDKTAMLIGAGKMSELAARHLLRAGIASVVVTNRSFDRAVELARDFDGTPVPFDRFPQYLHLADVVLGSVSVSGHVVSPSHLHDVMKARRRRPMFFIDLGVPRNFDPALNDLQNVYLYNIDDLARVADDHKAEREREAERAEEIVRSEAEELWRGLSARDVTPTIVALRSKLDVIRQTELDRALASLGSVGAGDRKVIESMTQAIVNKILHPPTTLLKEIAREDDGRAAEAAEVLQRLFGLERTEEEGGDGER